MFLEVSIVAAFVGSAGLSVALLERQTTEWPCFDSVNDRTFAFRLVPGSDLLDSLNNFTVEHSMHAGKVVGNFKFNGTSGYIITCVGSLTVATIRFANQSDASVISGPWEIVSLTGTLSDVGGSHVHISVSNSAGVTYGVQTKIYIIHNYRDTL